MRTRRFQRTEWSRASKAGAALLALALALALLRALAPDLFLRTLAPVFSVGESLSRTTGSFFAGFADARSLAAKNAELEERSAALLLENRTLSEKLADLGALLGTTTPAFSGALVAGVIARPPTAPYDTLILSMGSEEGARSSMAAFGAGGVPLGVVSGVTPRFCRVRLFSAPGVATDAWVGAARTPVTLLGAGGGAFSATVSRGSPVAEGDLVYLAGPGAIPIGQVAHVGGNPSDPIANLSITPLLNPFSVTWVALVERSTEWASSTPL
jgi:cell shape-determining protein MreC